MRKYKHKGYTFFATNNFISTKVRRFDKMREELRPVYHIDGLKDASAEPILTSMRQCINYIDIHWSKKRRSDP